MDLIKLLQERKAQRIKERQEEKAVLFAYLAEKRPEIQRIHVSYSGSGDEGYVDDIDYYDTGDQTVKLEDTELENMLDGLCWLVTPDRFYNDEGGQGAINIHPATQRIVVEHGQNVMETIDEEYEVKDGEPLPSQFE